MKTIELKWIEDVNHNVAEDAYNGLKELIATGVFPNIEVECKDDTLYITGEKEILDKVVMKIQKAYVKYGQIMIKEAHHGVEQKMRIESFDDNVQDIFNHTLNEYETFKENCKVEKPTNYITTLGKFQFKFNKLKEVANRKDKKIIQNYLSEIEELSENYEEPRLKPIKENNEHDLYNEEIKKQLSNPANWGIIEDKLDEGKLIDAAALMVYSQLVDMGYKNLAQQMILNNIDYINEHSNDNPSELTDNIIKRWKRQEKRKNKEYEKLNNESYEQINEDSLDDFDDTEIKKSINAQSDEVKQFVQTQRNNLWNYANDKMDALCKKCDCKRKYDDMHFNDWGISGRKPGAHLAVQIKIPYDMYKTLSEKDFSDWFYGDENCPFIPEHKYVSIYTRDMAPEVMIDFKIPEYVEPKKVRKPRKPRDPNKGYKKPDYVNPDMNGGTYFDGDTQVYEMPEENESFNEDYNFYKNPFRQMTVKRKRKLSKDTFNKKFSELVQTYANAEDLDLEAAYDLIAGNDEIYEYIDSNMTIEDIMDKISAGEIVLENMKIDESFVLSPSELKKKLQRVASKWASEKGVKFEVAYDELRKKKSVKDMLDFYSVDEIIDDLKKQKKEVDDELEDAI
ncbi:MAG: hypothetical protein J6T10_04460 [Methanobrevibacter sp.]|nr:hypothetical protein [Methanobrevibacter sp.]